MATRKRATVMVPGLGIMKIRPECVNMVEVVFGWYNEALDDDPAIFERDANGWRPTWRMTGSFNKRRDRAICSALKEWTETHRHAA